jgi:hypothetical protein
MCQKLNESFYEKESLLTKISILEASKAELMTKVGNFEEVSFSVCESLVNVTIHAHNIDLTGFHGRAQAID